MNDQLGDRMKKQYENRTRYFLPRRTYTLIRLDGKAFHTFTKGMTKPFDMHFVELMNSTASYLCEEIQGCKIGYVQSDEISLLLTDFEKDTTDAWFDGNIQKIASVSASMATAYFNKYFFGEDFIMNNGKSESSNIQRFIFDSLEMAKYAFFDARVFTIPDPTEVENYFIWRQKDAIRNSLSMYAQSLYSHKELNGKSQSDMHDMIHDKGENWDKLHDGFKRGRTYYKDNSGVWNKGYLDFLKERELLSSLIPKINFFIPNI